MPVRKEVYGMPIGEKMTKFSARKMQIYTMAKEVKETSDNKIAADLLTTGNWVITNAAIRQGIISWILIRIA